MRPHRSLRSCLHLWLAALLWGWAAAVQAAPPLQLPDDAPVAIDAWPAVSLLSDPDGRLDAAGALRRLADFSPPDGPHANLGPRRDVVWLYLPVQAVGGDGRWVLDIDYPPLHRIELTVLRDGQPVARHLMGSLVEAGRRPMRSRDHAVELQLAPNVSHALLLRVSTQTAMLLPMRLSKPAIYHARESRAGLLQGVLAGVALALIAYSLAHWLSLRDTMFLEYALMLGGLTVFFISYFGIGQQHLWGDGGGALAKVAPQGVLVALAGGGLFVAGSLRTRDVAPWTHRGLMGVTALATAGFLASLAGALDYRATQTLATAMGPLPMLLAIPRAWRQARAGDRLALYVLLGRLSYMTGALSAAGLLRGFLPVNFWTQHAFQFSCLLEMLLWTQVLSLRVAGIRLQGERAELERAALLSLAHTDALTGLPNRRGLQAALAAALPECQGGRTLALFLLDLDGFKPVNDRLGHDAGDALLVQVGQRMRQQVRHGDLVARLGGDEFVIMAHAVPGEAEALVLGRKLLAAFEQPFIVGGAPCRVGLTIGFALAPHDGNHADDLLKRADAAMYAGKQAGRHTVRRGGASARLTFSS
ncbi:MAG TPA: diguanylate cyclase [Aquabacterium sp.]|nr:diguanylate cyclase [Aquabacterium sp.]